MKRVCSSCGTPLPGRKGHGFVIGRKLLCGRREVEKTVWEYRENAHGRPIRVPSLVKVSTPDCSFF